MVREEQERANLMDVSYHHYKQYAENKPSLEERLKWVKEKMAEKERMSHDEVERKRYEKSGGYSEGTVAVQYDALYKLKHEVEEQLAKEEEKMAREQYERKRERQVSAPAATAAADDEEDVFDSGEPEKKGETSLVISPDVSAPVLELFTKGWRFRRANPL